MSENSRRMQRGISPVLKARGFTKAGTTWRRQLPEVANLLNLQGSVYGPSYYVNLGVHLLEPGARSPRLVEWHARIRLEQLVPDPKHLALLLDLGQPLSDASRFAELEGLLTDYALPWLDRLASVEAVRAMLSGEEGELVMITRETMRLLGLANDA